MTPVEKNRPATRGVSLVPLVPRIERPTGPVMQRGATEMHLTRFENQRTRASDGDTIKVFSVPTRVCFGLFPARQQIKSTEVMGYLERGQSVIAETAVMELGLYRGQELLVPRILPGKSRLTSVADLNTWLRKP